VTNLTSVVDKISDASSSEACGGGVGAGEVTLTDFGRELDFFQNRNLGMVIVVSK
jgi:hypothetical protein